MISVLVLLFFLLTSLVLLVPGSWKFPLSFALSLILALGTAIPAVDVLVNSQVLSGSFILPGFGIGPQWEMDSLSAFFILIIALGSLISIAFSHHYLQPYQGDPGNKGSFGLHYFSFLLLQGSMVGVCLLRDGFSFLVAWEIMSFSSFLLILFESGKNDTRRAAMNYLIQMHIGFVFLLLAFLFLDVEAGFSGFAALESYGLQHTNPALFLLFFVGFGMKAGLVPFHSWLPEAHPAAPSHISGLMSGVMIKMGVYGLFRVCSVLGEGILFAGLILFFFGLLSALYGIILATSQRDIKRLLAYSSIENIGIIFLGLGTGLIGKAMGNDLVFLLGFMASLLHVLNHSLFKPLLFYTAGSVYQACHTRDMEKMGGLIHRMPFNAGIFGMASLAICGLPPLNGFVSELLLFLGLFAGLGSGKVTGMLVFLSGITGLALTGGLAFLAFTKVFGTVFLGRPRSEPAAQARELNSPAAKVLWFPAFLLLLIGLFPLLALRPVGQVVIQTFGHGLQQQVLPFDLLGRLSWVLFAFFGLFAALLLFRRYVNAGKEIPAGPVWGCGYTGETSRMQYTGTSFIQDFLRLSHPLNSFRRFFKPYDPEEINPGPREFASSVSDPVARFLVEIPSRFFAGFLKKAAILQTGQLQHYVLYAFLFMLLVIILSLLNWL